MDAPGGRLERALKSAVCVGLYAALSAELLGNFSAFAYPGIMISWLLAAGGAVWLARQQGWSLPKLVWPEERFEQAALLSCVLVAGVCLVTALLSPPNNYDSMTYHMPRVVHWLQNRSLRQFPTQDLRQICFPPGSTYLIAELQAITGGDRFANLQEWAAFVGLMAAVALCAKRLGGDRRAQWLGAALVAGMPLVVLESTSAQNDVLVTFWVVSTLAFCLSDEPAWACGALALANLTKPTGLMFGGPVLLVGLQRSKEPWPRRLWVWSAVAVAAQLPAVPHYLRNVDVFGSPMGGITIAAMSRHSLSALVSCGLRDVALQIPLPGFWALVVHAHRWLGLNPNDRATSLGPFVRQRWDRLLNRLLYPDEDFAASPLQFVLIAAALYRRRWKDVAAAATVGALAYAGLIKWQEWGNRLVMPLFGLGLPLAAVWASERWKPWAQLALLPVMAFTGVFCDALHLHHPLMTVLTTPREQIYLHSGYGREHAQAIAGLSRQLAADRCDTVGLDFHEDDWEYPWWVLNPGTRFKRVNVENASSQLAPEFPDSELCAVILSRFPGFVYFNRDDLKKMSLAQIHAMGLTREQEEQAQAAAAAATIDER